MKRILLLSICIAFSLQIQAQNIYQEELRQNRGTYMSDLRVLYIKEDITLHFRSPEPINYVDISTDKIAGDIPIDNLAKIKLLEDTVSYKQGDEIGLISIVGDSYLAQYKLIYSDSEKLIQSEIPIVQEDMKNTQFPGVSLTFYEMKKLCMKVQQQKRRFNKVQSKSTGLRGHMNNIFAFGDYIFLDITFENDTKIKYDIDLITFHIDDKKIYKATNNQSIQITPAYTLYRNPYFHKTYRNVYVFKKFTYPNDKILKIRMEETQIGGRTLELTVDYKELLNADTF